MASCVLPQVLHTIPWSRTQTSECSYKLAFSTSLYRRPLISSRIAFCKISMNMNGFHCGFSLNSRKKRHLVVKAASNANGEVEASEGSVEETDEDSGEAAETKVEQPEATSQEEEVKAPWKERVKLGDVMGLLNKKAIEVSDKVRPVPDIRTGDVVEIKLEVPENRRRMSIYKGIVISKQNAGIHTTIRIRRILAGVGVETVFPIYSPNVKEIKVVSHRKVRRAKLYYLRDKLPRLSTFK